MLHNTAYLFKQRNNYLINNAGRLNFRKDNLMYICTYVEAAIR